MHSLKQPLLLTRVIFAVAATAALVCFAPAHRDNARADGAAGTRSSPARESLTISDPWARATPAGARMGAIYLRLRSASGDRLLGASVPRSVTAETQLHETIGGGGGSMKMREVSSIELPAGQTVELKPGGFHVMLMGLKHRLKAGEKVSVTLRFETVGHSSGVPHPGAHPDQLRRRGPAAVSHSDRNSYENHVPPPTPNRVENSRGSSRWEHEARAQSGAVAPLESERPTIQPGKVVHDGEAEAMAGGVYVCTRSSLHDPIEHGGVDAGTIIVDEERHGVDAAGRRHDHRGSSPLARVVEQIPEHLLEVFGLAPHDERFSDENFERQRSARVEAADGVHDPVGRRSDLRAATVG